MAAINFFSLWGALPHSPPPLNNLALCQTPTHGSGRGSAVPALGLAFRKSGRFHRFSREEWSGHHVKAPTTLAHWDARMHQPALGEATQGATAPELRAEASGWQPHLAPAGQSPERPTRPRPGQSRCRTARHRTPTGLRAAASLGPTGTRGQALPAHAGACLWAY